MSIIFDLFEVLNTDLVVMCESCGKPINWQVFKRYDGN